jgi:uncharacterized damage-inducible protein DinB
MPVPNELLTEFDIEMEATRRVLERVPSDRLDWKPHEKSMSLGRLATHVADLPRWVPFTMTTDGLDAEQPGDAMGPRQLESAQAMLDWFDEHAARARATIEGASEGAYTGTWTMRQGEQVYFSLPRWLVVRRFAINHMIHHRGQLTVYLRLAGVPVPGTFGPSADEM